METVFLYVLSFAVIYITIFFSIRFHLLSYSDNHSYLWRLNPSLTMPNLFALFLGMVFTPLIWEKTIRKIDLKQLGFMLAQPLFGEMLYAIIFLSIFVVYSSAILSKQINIFEHPRYVITQLFIIWLVTAFAEELFYRAIMQRRLSNLCGKFLGLILASIVFAFIGHFRAPLIDNLILRLPFGLILGYLYLRSGSLLFPVILHWGFNMLFAV
jgi:membrane protease YdiL (CAAX protease family)